MAQGLTPRQREVLEFIKRFLEEQGYPPTVREIGRHFGFVPRSVFDHLKALERKGYLKREATKSRSLQITDPAFPGRRLPRPREVPIVGRVAAGRPLLAVENLEGAVPLPMEWTNGGEVFLLRVQGDSMVGAHILSGDLALVRRQESAENGDIVVALVEEEATVKRFQRSGQTVTLFPENPAMAPITLVPGARFEILGKVIGVFRRLP
ncbi:MAG TPA: transcriptional repressor LexA [Candidatus Methylomirabilis sp.]|jgi:repressor LexA|nr:transcriptional repressor LexA [Candidatus Methylomirabilis sp.]